jgi:GTP-binding protein
VTPVVAIVGRPNVGKSTLFNRLLGRPLAIVHDAPGVTRDRRYASAFVHGRELTLIDTGGFDRTGAEPLERGIVRQVKLAVEEAQVIVCVLDGSSAPTSADGDMIQELRQSGKRVLYAANKLDSANREAGALDLYELGIEHLLPISALHGRGLVELERSIAAALPPPVEEQQPPSETVARVALLGRPNAGKSSLFNHLAGVERALVDTRPGTTRDPVDTRIDYRGKAYLLVDTAGVRRRARVDRGVEAVSVIQALRVVDRAEVVVLLCDATAGVSEQDARLLGLCIEKSRAIVVGLNKIDLLNQSQRRRVEEAAREALTFAPWAPLVPLSAKTGTGIEQLMRRIWVASSEFKRRVPTAELNRFFEQVIERQPPPTSSGRAPRLFYITQAETAPPVFVAMSSAPQAIPQSYRRFVSNQLREAFGFESVPVIVRYRSRRRRDR